MQETEKGGNLVRRTLKEKPTMTIIIIIVVVVMAVIRRNLQLCFLTLCCNLSFFSYNVTVTGIRD